VLDVDDIKGDTHFLPVTAPRPNGREEPEEIIDVDAPGPSPATLARLDSRRGWRPIFPLDPEATVP